MRDFIPLQRRNAWVAAIAVAAAVLASGNAAKAADHRDAPAVDSAIEGDINDVYAFRDPKRPERLVVAMNVNPFAVPGVRHSYRFNTEYLYQIKIDRDADFREDFVIQVKFRDTPSGQVILESHGPVAPGYVGAYNRLIEDQFANQGPLNTVIGDITDTQVWAGQADDPFVVDVAQFFRIVLDGTQAVFRDIAASPVGPLPGRSRRADGTSAIDTFGGFNSSFIVVSFPLEFVRGQRGPRVNIWGTVSAPLDQSGSYVQFERMGQPLFNTVFVPGPLKDAFNTGTPDEDVRRWSQYVPDALTSNDTTGNTIAGRATLLTALGLTALPNGVPLLLPGTLTSTDRGLLRGALLPDVLRIDLDLPPNDLAIGQFGLHNGRRYGDDVVDIALRLIRQLADVNFPAALNVPGSGPARPGALTFGDARITAVLQGTDFMKPDAQLVDVTTSGNDRPFMEDFPYLPLPHPRPGDPIGN